MWIRDYLRKYRQRQHVRPWALAAPVVILLIALPLLRPLRQVGMGAEEAATLSAVQAMVEKDLPASPSAPYSLLSSSPGPSPLPTPTLTPALPPAPKGDRPVFVFLLSGCYWVLHQFGLRFAENPILASYLLTVIGVTLPVALSAGLIYRMGRLFELRRPWRTGLALSAVLATGLFSYATVLNPQAPAAVAVLWSAACLIHVAIVGQPNRSGAWLAMAGLLAAGAAVMEPAAGAFLVLLPLVILAMRWAWSLRVAGVLLYALGALPPLALHFVLLHPDPIEGVQTAIADSREFLASGAGLVADESELAALPDPFAEDWEDAPISPVAREVGEFVDALLGPHGLLSHFPVMAMAVVGVFAVMHRHWPMPTKMLAAVTLGAAAVIVTVYAGGLDRAGGAGFASRWFVVFGPVMLFWCGAWLRRKHHPATWSAVGVVLGFSVIVSLLGATNPLPPSGYQGYTVAGAVRALVIPANADPERAVTTVDQAHDAATN